MDSQGRLTRVISSIGCCVCEKELEAGKEYLLFVQPSWNLHDAQMVSFCDPNKEVGNPRKDLARLGSPRRVLSPRHFDETASEALGFGVDRVGNVAARMIIARSDPHPFVEDPLKPLMELPWYVLVGRSNVPTWGKYRTARVGWWI